MGSENALLGCGVSLLAVSALLGFVQHRYRHQTDEFALWRVVHSGGTAGAVQLLALAAVWQRFGARGATPLLATGLIVSTLAFFLGPLAKALHWPRVARWLLGVGALVAAPTYLALPTLLRG